MAEQTQTQVVKKAEPQITEMVLQRVNQMQSDGGINLPGDYSAANALRAAYLIIADMKDSKNGVPVLQVVKKESVYNALFNMTTQGLNPAKRQCSFIQYGDKLHMQREYAGSIALAKRYGDVKEINAVLIYEGESPVFEIDTTTGRKKLISHNMNWENIDDAKIKGAYAIVQFNDGSTNVEIMTMAQIRKSWDQGQAKGQSPAHKNFPGEMAKKTVINRACKLLIASSDDSVLFEPGEDGRIPRAALAEGSAPALPEPTQPQIIDIPDEPQVAQVIDEPPVEVKPEPKGKQPKSREWEKEEAPNNDPGF